MKQLTLMKNGEHFVQCNYQLRFKIVREVKARFVICLNIHRQLDFAEANVDFIFLSKHFFFSVLIAKLSRLSA